MPFLIYQNIQFILSKLPKQQSFEYGNSLKENQLYRVYYKFHEPFAKEKVIEQDCITSITPRTFTKNKFFVSRAVWQLTCSSPEDMAFQFKVGYQLSVS